MALPGPLAIERAGLKAWPGIEVEWDGFWVRRAANGYTKRANSAQCFDPADDADVPARVAAARRWFETRELRPIFRVNLLTGQALAARLDAEAWLAIDHSRLMATEIGDVTPDPRGEIQPVHAPEFLDTQRQLQGYDDAKLQNLRAILGRLEVPAAGVVLRSPDGRPVSSSLMAVADGIVITGNVVTDPRERRKGFAAAMMRTGLAWARSAGATVAALNVQASNPPGLALYQSLGYRPQYDYVYRTPGAA